MLRNASCSRRRIRKSSRDPGGMTNLGVTKKVYDEWTGRESTEQEMRDLTPEDVAPIYKKNYWDRVKGDSLPSGLDWALFRLGCEFWIG